MLTIHKSNDTKPFDVLKRVKVLESQLLNISDYSDIFPLNTKSINFACPLFNLNANTIGNMFLG